MKTFPSFKLLIAILSLAAAQSLLAATSISYRGITWTFSADRPTGTFANGEPWVLGPVSVTGISPGPAQTVSGAKTQNGSMKNPIPNTHHGFDGNPDISAGVTYKPELNVALSLPIQLAGGDVLVSARSKYSYPDFIQTVCALTVVSSAPPEGSFRPGIYGTDRTVKWNKSQLNYSVLRNLAPVAGAPTKAEVEAMLPPLPWFEWAQIFSGNLLQPIDNTATNNRQYGREIAYRSGVIGLWLNLSNSQAEKEKAVIQFVQNGIDIHEYIKAGGGFYHDGGHKCGRKLPVVIAAMMLNDPALRATAANPDLFQEDTQTFIVSQADVGRAVVSPKETYLQSDVGMGEWGVRHRFEPAQDDRRLTANYRSVVGPAMMGPWLTAHLMGAQAVWNHPPAFAYMERFKTLFGTGSTFADNMWSTHKGGGVTLPPESKVITPVISPGAGTYEAPQTVSITTSTSAATIRYTTNGGIPGETSTVYTAPIPISSTTTVRAIAYASGMTASNIADATLTFAVIPPTISPNGGVFTNPQSVTLSAASSGATIHYTTDGSVPTIASPVYTQPFTVSGTTTVRAIAVRSGLPASEVSSALFAFNAHTSQLTWTNMPIQSRSGTFTLSFSMIASAQEMDGVVGFSKGAASGFTDLACIVRFNPNGYLDARNGGTYQMIASQSYQPGLPYRVLMTVNTTAGTYSVSVTPFGGQAVEIARNFSFRTEQTGLQTIDNFAFITVTGAFSLADLNFQPQVSLNPPQGLRRVRPQR